MVKNKNVKRVHQRGFGTEYREAPAVVICLLTALLQLLVLSIISRKLPLSFQWLTFSFLFIFVYIYLLLHKLMYLCFWCKAGILRVRSCEDLWQTFHKSFNTNSWFEPKTLIKLKETRVLRGYLLRAQLRRLMTNFSQEF